MTTPDLLTLAARIAVDKDIESLRESAKDALEFAKFLHQYNMAVIQHSLVMQAQNEFQQMKQQQLATDRRYTEGAAKENAARRRTGGASRPSGGSSSGAPKAKLSDLTKYLK